MNKTGCDREIFLGHKLEVFLRFEGVKLKVIDGKFLIEEFFSVINKKKGKESVILLISDLTLRNCFSNCLQIKILIDKIFSVKIQKIK